MLDVDFKAMYPVNVTNTGAHGGRMGNTQIVSNASENVFRNKSSAERAAGVIEYKKVFAKAADDADASLVVCKAFLNKPLEGDDWCTIFAGTQTDVLSSITDWDTGADTKTKYGVAAVTTDVVLGSRTIKVTVKNAKLLAASDDKIFRVGDMVRLANDSNSEFLEIAALAESSLEITVTTTADISRAYTVATNSRLSSVLEIGTIATSSAVVGHTGGADYDATTYPPLLDNIGTLEQRLLFTFGDSTNFTVTGDTLLALGTGVVSADFVATNTALSKPLATFEKEGWAGLTISAGDTFTVDIHPAAYGIWEKRETPAGAASTSYSNANLIVTGEVA